MKEENETMTNRGRGRPKLLERYSDQVLRTDKSIHRRVKMFAAEKSTTIGPAIGKLLDQRDARLAIDAHVSKTAALLEAWTEAEPEMIAQGCESVGAFINEMVNFIQTWSEVDLDAYDPDEMQAARDRLSRCLDAIKIEMAMIEAEKVDA